MDDVAASDRKLDFRDKVCVIAGAAQGLGASIARVLAQRGARVCVVDRDEEGARRLASEIGGLGLGSDITQKGYEVSIIEDTRRELGGIDLWFTNAGIGGAEDFLSIDDDEWCRMWNIHVLSHARAARALLPAMLERGEGYLAQTASGTALFMQGTQASYSVTKHAALALNEWLHVTYRPRGIRVSCFCPLGMKTQLMKGNLGITPAGMMAWSTALEPDEAGEIAVRGLEKEEMLILSQPEVLEAFRSRANDHAAWLANPFPHYRRSAAAQADVQRS